MTKLKDAYPYKVDLSNCEKEPIHIIGKAQSHGVILACNSQTWEITQLSDNTEKFFGIKTWDLLGTSLRDLIGEDKLQQVAEGFNEKISFVPVKITLNNLEFLMLPYYSGENLVIDFEPAGKLWDSLFFQQQLTWILNRLSAAPDLEAICRETAIITRNIFEYDRVMIYKFDEEWNGEVIAEEKKEDLDSWLGLHYPSTDIPAQSRKMFLKNKVRIITDVNYSPVPLVPEISPITNQPLDLSLSQLRGVSPIHIEYLQNMKVGASLTAAIIVSGKLWGLITCHHSTSKFINYFQRETCRFLTQVFANQLNLRSNEKFIEKNRLSDGIRAKLVKQMQRNIGLSEALIKNETLFTRLIECTGGAVVLDGEIALTGKTPDKSQLESFVNEFLQHQDEHVFFSKNISAVYAPGADFRESASGMLSLRIGEDRNNYLLWFRPEISETVSWGGNPQNKASYNEKEKRLSPRKSFEKWTEKLRGVSQTWQDYEISAARLLRESISHVIIEKQKEKIELLNTELTRANEEMELFSYSISHDLRAPLRGIEGFVKILQEDHSEEFSDEVKELLNTVLRSAENMDELIDELLSLFKITKGEINKHELELKELIEDVLEIQNPDVAYPDSKIIIKEDLPRLSADKRMLTQLLSNLIGNALKYSSKTENAVVEIGSLPKNGKQTIYIRDNGPGFDPSKTEAVFDIFTRFASNEFKGTGIGLAVVKRIVEKHHGRVWAETKPGEGSCFYFHL